MDELIESAPTSTRELMSISSDFPNTDLGHLVLREALVAAGIDWELADHLGSFVAETSIRHGSSCSEIGIHISTALSEDLGEQYDWWTPQGVLEQWESANRQNTFLYGDSGFTLTSC